MEVGVWGVDSGCLHSTWFRVWGLGFWFWVQGVWQRTSENRKPRDSHRMLEHLQSESFFFFFFITPDLELSNTKVYEP